MKPTLGEISLEFKTRVVSLLLSRGEHRDSGTGDVWELIVAGLHMMREQAYGASSVGLIVWPISSVGLIAWPIDYSACAIYQDGPGDAEKRNYLGIEEALPRLRALMILEDLADV